jgi:hypothetical protein
LKIIAFVFVVGLHVTQLLKKNDIVDVAPHKPDDKWHLRLAQQLQLQQAAQHDGLSGGAAASSSTTAAAGHHQDYIPSDEIDQELSEASLLGATSASNGRLSIAGAGDGSSSSSLPPRPSHAEVDSAVRILMRLGQNSRSKPLQIAARRVAYEVFQERLIIGSEEAAIARGGKDTAAAEKSKEAAVAGKAKKDAEKSKTAAAEDDDDDSGDDDSSDEDDDDSEDDDSGDDA